jgi:hypothetical protein
MKISDVGRHTFGICAAMAMLAGCAGSQVPIGAPLIAPSASSVHPSSELSGERLSSAKATSSCSSKYSFSITGSFHASGKARGPFSGKFTARGRVNVTFKTISFDEHFKIRSGSQTIAGFARFSNASGSPTFGCSKKSNGKLSFSLSDLRYRVKHSHAHGSASSSLYRGSFSESFK